MIIEDAPESVKGKILEVDSFIMNWIEKSREWGIPRTLQEAKTKFEEVIIPLYDTLKLYSNSENKSIILIPDTNALISKPNPLAYKDCINQEKFTLAILPAVLMELEELKMESWDIAFRNKVRSVIKRLNGFRNQGNLHEGIIVHKTIRIKMYSIEPDFTKALSWFDKDNNDDRIIASAIQIQRANPSDYVIIATSDINLINKAEMAYFPYVEFD
jgi:predicted ribonuclease YlaK